MRSIAWVRRNLDISRSNNRLMLAAINAIAPELDDRHPQILGVLLGAFALVAGASGHRNAILRMGIEQLTAATRARTDDVAREVSQTLHDWTAEELRTLRQSALDVVRLVDSLLPGNDNTNSTIRAAELDMSAVVLGGERLLPGGPQD